MNESLERFLSAQEYSYQDALEEIKNGKKTSHWIWYVFPQLKGLGQSFNSEYYGLDGKKETKEYMENEILKSRLLEITTELLNLEENDIHWIMGFPDDLKLQSCMTLYYDGIEDENTIKILKNS